MERQGQREIAAAIAKLKSPVFLAKWSEARGGGLLVLHTTDRAGAATLSGQFQSVLGSNRDVRYRVTVHRPARLGRSKSLQALVATFGAGEIIHDPTGVIRRAEALTACAADLRAALGDCVDGVYVDSNRRALLVILDRKHFAAAGDVAERVAAMDVVGNTVKAWRASRAGSFDLSVRIGFELPDGIALAAVDRSSERATRRSLMERLRKPGIAATLASLLGLGTVAQAVAADATLGSTPGVLAPAVAAPNIGLIAGGGFLNGGGISNQGWGAVGVKATVPLGEHFGGQIDAAVGGDSYTGVGGHLFWRDPSVGLLGVVASTESMSGSTLSRFAVEGEVYKNDFTLRGEVGGETGTIGSGAFGGVDVTFYAKPTLALALGGELGPVSVGRASVEWQPALQSIPGLSLFADGQVSSNGNSRVLAGLKYYFGTSGASLKDRDRKYDPDFSLFNTQGLASTQGYIQGTN